MQSAHLAQMEILNEKTLQIKHSYSILENKLDAQVSAKLAAVELERIRCVELVQLERLRVVELGRADSLAFRDKFANFVCQRAAACRANVVLRAAFVGWKSHFQVERQVSSLASFEQTVARQLGGLHAKADALQSELDGCCQERNRLQVELDHARSSSAASLHAAEQEESRLWAEVATLTESRLQLERVTEAHTKRQLELERMRERLQVELDHARSSSAASLHAAEQEEARLRSEVATLAQKELELRLQLERATEAHAKVEVELDRTRVSESAIEHELAAAFKDKLLAERALGELRQHLKHVNLKVVLLEEEIQKTTEANQQLDVLSCEQNAQLRQLHLLECERNTEVERLRTELAELRSDLAAQRRKVEELLTTADVAEEANRRNEWQLSAQDRIFSEQKVYFRSLISELKAHQELMHQEVLRLQTDLSNTLSECENYVEGSIIQQYESANKCVRVSTHVLDRLLSAAANFEPLESQSHGILFDRYVGAT